MSIVARKAAGIPLVTTAFAEAGNQVVSDQHELVGGGAEEHTTEQAVEEAAAHEEAVHQEQATVEGQVHQKTQEEAFHELEAIQHQHQVFLDHEEAEQDQEDTQSQQQPQPQPQLQQQQQQQQQEGDGHVGDGTLSHAEEDQHPQETPQNAAQPTKAPIPHKEVPQFSESFFVTASVVDDTKDPYQVILRQTFAHDLATNRYAMKAVGLLINGFLEQIIQRHAKDGLGGGFVNVYANSTANLPPKQKDQTLYNEYKGEYNEFSNEEEDLIGDKSHEKASKMFVHHEEAGALHCTNSTWNCPMPAPRFWNFPANATYLGPQQVPPPLIMPVALDPDLVEQNPLGGMFEGWEYWIGGERYEVYAVYTAPVWVGKVYSSTGSHLLAHGILRF